MRIAQIAPLHESVPPKLYGGTERIVSYLTEALVAQGHEVTLFASGDSVTAAELVPCCDVALRLNPGVKDALPHHVVQMEAVRRRADAFDVLHFHTDLVHLPLVHGCADRTVTTLHGRLDLPDLMPVFRTFAGIPFASISDSQRLPVPPLNWAGTVLHGLPPDLLPFSPQASGGYLAFLGRISPEKGPDRAIRIATKAGMRLRIAAKIDRNDREYWEEVIRPMVETNPLVEFVGEINEAQKPRFLGDAVGLLFPIDWPEPFGLVMIEAMACGTPVLATRCGSVPEVVEDGVSGFIAESEAHAAALLPRLAALDRAGVRAAFDRRFTAERMAADYLALYHALPGVRTQAAHLRRAHGEETRLQVVAGD